MFSELNRFVGVPPGQPNSEATTLRPSSEVGQVAPEGTGVRYFGDYELLEEIARGGMGVVYKARQVSLNRTVALKMILAGQLASAEDVQRFHTEAQAAAQLDHPGIVPIFEVGQHAGQHYFSMGYIEGQNLAARVALETIAPLEAATLVQTLAEAVEYAHQKGIIHRDLKPENVLMDAAGNPRITDFGVAKQVQGDNQLTSTGQILGTPSYMPPEQAEGKVAEIGPTADVYALGAILYRLLTGRPPFQAANPLDTLVCVLEQDPVPPQALNRRTPRDLNVICMKCLPKNPVHRYGSARALADDLQRFLRGDVIDAKPLSLPRRALRWARHRPRLASVLVTIVAFYVYHLICLAAGNEGSQGTFHWLATGTALLVCGYAWLFQTLMMQPRAQWSLLYWWVTTDIVFLTLFVMFAADGAQSPIVVIYLCMVASASLSFDRQMVWLVTAACVVSYGIVVLTGPWCRPDLPMTPYRVTIPVAISMLAIGLAQYYVVRCSRVQRRSQP